MVLFRTAELAVGGSAMREEVVAAPRKTVNDDRN
jgi:hypothetical protein